MPSLGTLSNFVIEERLQHRYWQIHRSTAQRRLRVRRYESRTFTFELSRDPENSSGSIKVAPPQAERFSSTKSRRQHEGVQRLAVVSSKRLEEASRLFGRERSTFVTHHFG
jgi:hypothetical protein